MIHRGFDTARQPRGGCYQVDTGRDITRRVYITRSKEVRRKPASLSSHQASRSRFSRCQSSNSSCWKRSPCACASFPSYASCLSCASCVPYHCSEEVSHKNPEKYSMTYKKDSQFVGRHVHTNCSQHSTTRGTEQTMAHLVTHEAASGTTEQR